ncbi:MAG: hypothetical protein ACJZ89_00405 [Paracoccaceae bacterium]
MSNKPNDEKCMVKNEFYGFLNQKTNNNHIFIGSKVSDLLRTHKSNAPNKIKNLKFPGTNYKSVLITGQYMGNTSYVHNVSYRIFENRVIFSNDFVETNSIGASVMNHPFWAAQVSKRCKILKN